MIDKRIAGVVLRWGGSQRRDLPWRATRDAWAVLVSEVMLQQTQVDRVIEPFERFLNRFPTPNACAASPAADVIVLWSGLGYNRRAVGLWRTAVAIGERHDGEVPDDLADLLALPGIGPYTARAVLAFAFERDVGVVDTNVGRLLARWSGETLASRQAQSVADELVPTGSAWAWNQTLFDFANAICRKRDPQCVTCPVQPMCVWRGDGVDPANASAGVSAGQSPFVGSKRQVRGRIVAALTAGPIGLADLSQYARPEDTEVELGQILDGLVADGLVAVADGKAHLASC